MTAGRRYANVASTLALVVALGGTGYAASTLAAHSVGTRQLKTGAVTSKKVKNFSLSYKDFKGGQLGLVLGYAHVNADATVDTANSFEVGAANVQQAGLPGGTCFYNLPFTVHGAVITEDGSGAGGGNVTSSWLAGDPAGDCIQSNAVGEVVVAVNGKPGSRAGFYIVFF